MSELDGVKGGGPGARRSWIYRAVHAIAPVKRGEAISALLFLVNIFVLLTSYYVLKVVREPLILAGGGAELKAYATGGQAILMLFAVPVFGWLATHVNRIWLLTVMQLFFIACLIAFYFLAKAEAPVGLAFYLWLGVYNMFVVSNFWSFANDVYTPEQGKRLFPIIGVGGSIGAILGARAPKWLANAFGIYELFLIVAGALAISVLIYWLVDKRERHERDVRTKIAIAKPEAVHPVGREGGFRLVLSDKYLRVMALMIMLGSLVNTTGEYVISNIAEDNARAYAAVEMAAFDEAHPASGSATTPDPVRAEQRAAVGAKATKKFIGDFFSDYYSLVNIVVFLLQALVVARLIHVLGIRKALFVMPVIVMAGWVGFLMFATLTTIRATKLAENSLDYSLHNTLRHALFLPTSRASKYKAKAAIDTFFVRTADAVSGLLLVPILVFGLHLGVRAFAIINIVFLALWLVLATVVGRLHDQRAKERSERAARGLRETAP